MIRATLDLRSYKGPLSNDGSTLDELFCLDADISGILIDRDGASFELSGTWRVVSRQIQMGPDGECHAYSLERVP